MKIEWAPVRVPAHRRAQTLAIALFVFILFTLPTASILLVAYGLLYAGFVGKLLTIAYLTQMYYNHTRNYSDLWGNGWKIWRRNILWSLLREYFPIDLVKTADLTPNRNYLIACYPHGVVGFSFTTNLAIDIEKWLQLFPGVRPKLATLNIHFWVPIWREVVRTWGAISVSKESITYYLSKSNDPKSPQNADGFTSNAVAVVVGGAQEALDARPGKYVITLKNRKGFIKIAIKTGAAIVPSFSFGEVDIFDQLDNPPDSYVRRFQVFIKKITGISPLFLVGRGIFQYSFGLLPRRAPIVQVVGAPIEIIQNDQPTDEYVDEIHCKFMTAINNLFEKNKGKYTQHPEKTKLVIQ